MELGSAGRNKIPLPLQDKNSFLHCNRTVSRRNISFAVKLKLKPHFKDGKLPITAWRRERAQLEQDYKEIQSELSPLHADAKKLWAIHYNIYEVQHEQERQNAATRQKSRKLNTNLNK